jgi:hypothetical protein
MRLRTNATSPCILVALAIVMSAITAFDSVPLHASETLEIRLPVRESEFDAVLDCQNNPDPDCRSCLAGAPSSASLVIYSILQKALTTGGLAAKVKIIASPNSERSRKMISDGFADVKSDWNFNIDADPEVLKSTPILRNGEFEKGIYVSQDTYLSSTETAISDVNQLRAVSIRTWRLDWEVLENLEPRSLTNAAATQQMYAMINAGRADFTLLEFTNKPRMVRENDGTRLYPMPGVKVILPGSQHFMVSRKLPDARNIIAALDKGLDTLHKDGFVRQCLVNSGIINENVTNWQVLNPLAIPADGPVKSPS